MKKLILNIGNALSKKEQKNVNGGTGLSGGAIGCKSSCATDSDCEGDLPFCSMFQCAVLPNNIYYKCHSVNR